MQSLISDRQSSGWRGTLLWQLYFAVSFRRLFGQHSGGMYVLSGSICFVTGRGSAFQELGVREEDGKRLPVRATGLVETSCTWVCVHLPILKVLFPASGSAIRA